MTTTAPMTLDLGATQQVPIGRLATVELRKALDTRAGRWFTVSILALVLVVQVIYASRRPRTRRATATSSASQEGSWATSCRS